jgi:tetratricopeptide (TPR) repeat protein
MRNRVYIWFVLSVFSFSVQAAPDDNVWLSLISKGNSAFRDTKLDDAFQLFEQSLQAAGQQPEHLAVSTHYVAMVHQTRGDYKQAETLYLRALDYWKNVKDPVVELITATYNNLGDLLTDKHEFVRAQESYAKAVALWKDVKDAKPGRIAFAMSKLASSYNLNGESALAESLLKQAIAMHRASPESDSIDLATSLDCLAKLYTYQSRFEQAEPLFQEALSLVKRVAGERNPVYGIALQNLATMHRLSGNSARAEPLLRKAGAIYQDSFGVHHPYLVMIWNEQGLIAAEEKKYSEAISYMQKAFDLSSEVFGRSHLRSAFVEGNLALVYIRSGKLDRGKHLLMEALAVQRSSPDIAPEEYARTLTNCANLSLMLRDTKQAEIYFSEAIPIWRRMSNRYGADLAGALQGYARALKASKNPDARKFENEAKAFLETKHR